MDVQPSRPPASYVAIANGGLNVDFANDPRLHFSKESNTWVFEDDDGNEMEWDAAKGTWRAVASISSIRPIYSPH